MVVLAEVGLLWLMEGEGEVILVGEWWELKLKVPLGEADHIITVQIRRARRGSTKAMVKL